MTYNEVQQKVYYRERVGKVYGCFEVVSVEYDKKLHRQLWTMKCVHCGTVKKTYNGKDYAKGKNKGICKCQRAQKPVFEKPKKIKRPSAENHPLHTRWESMKRRCYDPKDKDYINYGARGITVCNEWKHDFWSFVKWAEESGFSPELTIDRIENEKGYSPDNCRWIPRSEQNRNKRNVHLYNGKTLPEICKKEGVSDSTIRRLLEKGNSIDDAVQKAKNISESRALNRSARLAGICPETAKKRMGLGLSKEEAIYAKGNIRKHFCTINGVCKSLTEWCKEYDITPPAVLYRIKTKGMSMEEALKLPKNSQNKKAVDTDIHRMI
jgi:hypothetical protein